MFILENVENQKIEGISTCIFSARNLPPSVGKLQLIALPIFLTHEADDTERQSTCRCFECLHAVIVRTFIFPSNNLFYYLQCDCDCSHS